MIKIKAKIKDQKSKLRKGIAPLVLIIVIGIVLAAGGLGLGLAWKAGLLGKPGGGPTDGTTTNGTQPQPPPQAPPSNGEEDLTKDWKTYVNDKYGYSVKYPQNWSYEVGNQGNALRPADMVAFSGIWVSVESSNGAEARDFIRSIVSREWDPDGFGVVYEDISLGGLPGIRVTYDYPGMGGSRITYAAVVKSGYGYYLELIYDTDTRAGLEIFEAMLTTFKFL